MIDCPGNDCDGSVDPEDLESFPFHDPVQCPVCKRWWETDWDYFGYDNMGWWFTGELFDEGGEHEVHT